MKKICIMFLFLVLPLSVQAESLNLEKLEVLNGELSLPFDPFNNQYTVQIEKDIFTLDLEYIASPEIEIEIINNHDLENNSIVTIELKEEKNIGSYYLHILKEEEQTTTVFREELESISPNFMYEYKIFIIPAACLFIILFFHKILFHYHKKKII